MWLYLVKRLALSVAIILLAVAALFVMLHSIPGDPASIALGPRATPEVQAAYAAKMHLDKPLYYQFGIFVGNVLQGDLGSDVFSNRPVAQTMADQLPYTLTLAAAALLWSAALGIPLGCYAAVRPNSIIDRITGILSVGTIAVPSFLVSIWAILVFSIALRWMPVLGAGDEGDIVDQLHHLIMPAFAVGLGWVGYLARMVRATMLEVMGENYIRSAKAFGLRPRTIVFRYALKVAILPTITLIGVGFGGLLSGTVFAEIIFSRPGVGKVIYDMVLARNFPVVQGAVLVTIAMYVCVTLIADLVVSWLDPRVRDTL
ncbi:MAG: ABC transporter permease [Rhodospirillales bacterium]